MLVLSREVDQVICIGKDIRVQVVDIRGSKVRLGIDAPDGVAVDREEVAVSKGRELIKPQSRGGKDGYVPRK